MFPGSQTLPPSELPLPPDQTVSAGANSPTTVISAYKELSTSDDEAKDILEEARERFAIVESWENPWRDRVRQEFDFVDGGKHWDEQMLQQRKGLPCLVFDRITPDIDQVVNNARQDPPEPRVSPVGDGADEQTAEVLQGMIRNIENDSSGEVVYMTGYEHAVKVGRGWWRVLTDWEEDDPEANPEDGFKQKLILDRISNPMSVYPDPSAKKFDYSDMNYCFVTEDLDKTLYDEEYPESKAASGDYGSLSDAVRNEWFPKGAVRVAEYWYVRKERYVLAMLEDGTVKKQGAVLPGERIRTTRDVEKRKVYCAKINGSEVLQRREWLGKWIPLIPVLGKEIIREGKPSLRGMVRPAMDSNLAYDYARSKLAEAVGLAPMSQWLVAEGQIENYEWQYAESNRNAHAYLTYKTVVNGVQVPPPIRISPAVDVSSLTQSIQISADDIRARLVPDSTFRWKLAKALVGSPRVRKGRKPSPTVVCPRKP